MHGGRYATQWRELYPQTIRSSARGLTISALARFMRAGGRMRSLLRRPRVQVLLLHHVFPDEENRFRRLLQILRDDHAFISYSEAVRRADLAGEQVDRPYITFTFDDGLKNCLRTGPIMQEFGARGCFFVCPGIVGETRYDKVAAFCRQRLQSPPVEFMDWDELQSLCDQGHEIGGHTMTHANLARVSPAQAADEIGQSYQSLKQRLGEARHFAWTFGRFADFTPQAARAVYDVGYQSCASGVRGCHGPQRSTAALPICLRRDNLIAGRAISHARYFLARSSRDLSPSNGDWPENWAMLLCGIGNERKP